MNRCKIFLLAVIALANKGAGTDVEIALKEAQIIPDIISSAPACVVEVCYGCKEVRLGNELTPTEVKYPPTTKWYADPEALYLLIMADPDVPSRRNPSLRAFLHWMVGNIPGNNVNMGETFAQYIGSAPPKGSGLHRYVFILYKQPKQIVIDEPFTNQTSAKYLSRFSIRDFATKYNLIGPEAANFFQAKYDDYVPIIQSKLKL